ncbi:hypothetical protein [Pseudorhizobium flavum]|uniref:hypothetical protein n=1 Tax=Pseudorhizobium flavum TaxID=1335061 RepID=UPI0037701800
MMAEITQINGADVFEVEFKDHATFIALALDNSNFEIHHEQDADYGQMTICTLSEGLYAYVRVISEHQIGQPSSGLFAHAYVKTENEFENGVSFYEVEIHEDANWSEDQEDEAA